MHVLRLIGLCCVLALVELVAGSYTTARAAEEKPLAETNTRMKEMPLLDGEVWKVMTGGEKVAFVWGVGHVVTMETDIMDKRPELKRIGFVTKMAEGLSGMPMNDIVGMINGFYAEKPELSTEPVMKVMWDRIVKPRIKAGFVDEPKE